MNTKKQYTAPFTEVVRLETEGRLAIAVFSKTNINNTGEGDGRDEGSIDIDNSGDLGGITPAKDSGFIWDEYEDEEF